MLMPQADRRLVYERLIADGVLVVRNDVNATKHAYLKVKNLHAMKAMQSLHSREYVTKQFSWMWYYYVLTPKGLQYLREYLHLPETVAPATMQKPKTAPRAPTGRPA